MTKPNDSKPTEAAMKEARAKKLTDPQKIGILASQLLFVIQGLRSGSIESQPILLTDTEADEYPMISLESELWKALNKCGIKEQTAQHEPKKGAEKE